MFDTLQLNWGNKSELGQVVSAMKTAYANAKQDVLQRFPDLIDSNQLLSATLGNGEYFSVFFLTYVDDDSLLTSRNLN
jgi:hypothetical protein